MTYQVFETVPPGRCPSSTPACPDGPSTARRCGTWVRTPAAIATEVRRWAEAIGLDRLAAQASRLLPER
jgi:hypothetical protein